MGSSASSITRRVAFGLGATLWAAGRRRRLPPGDESVQDPAFSRFLTRLRTVSRQQDGAALRALCAEDVITGIDATPGPAELQKKMQAGGWKQLETVLGMGAARYERGFVLPYLFAKFPEDLEAFEYMVAIRPGAALRSAGRADAPVVCPLDYDILRVADARPVHGWIRATRLDGLRGWAAESDVRSPGAERIFLEVRNGAWKITAWAAGD